ncbi:MAG: hypothetical protein QXR31_01435 [Zestosphaera sp.]
MSIEVENWQYIEIIDKLTSLLDTVADKQTQQQIKDILDTIKLLVSKESKQDTIISALSDISTKIDSILSQLGQPKPTYVATVLASSVGANKHHLVLFNNNQEKVVKIRRIVINAEVTSAVTGYELSYRIQRISNVTGGTAVTINKYDTQDPDPTGITAVTNPTSATVITTLDSITVNPEETGGQHSQERRYGESGTKPITLYYGQGISIQQYGTAGVGTVTCIITFTIE